MADKLVMRKPVNVFDGLHLNDSFFNELGKRPKTTIILNAMYSEVVTKLIRFDGQFNEFFFNDLTLTIRPALGLNQDESSGLYDWIGSKWGELNWFDSNLKNNRVTSFPSSEEVVKITIGGLASLRAKEMGAYLPNRNAIVLFFNPFKWQWDDSALSNEDYLKVHKAVIEAIKKVKPGKVDITETVQKVMVANFENTISGTINKYNDEIVAHNGNVEEAMAKIVTETKEVTLKRKELVHLSEMKSKVQTQIIKSIEEISNLPFVQEVTLESTGIKVNVGKISLKGKENGTVYSIYAGDYTLFLLPNRIKVLNKDRIVDSEGKLRMSNHHPHIDSDGKPCWGDASVTIAKMQGELKLKEIVFHCYAFLKRYSDDNPYSHIREWDIRRKEENRFDVEGNLLAGAKRATVDPEQIEADREEEDDRDGDDEEEE